MCGQDQACLIGNFNNRKAEVTASAFFSYNNSMETKYSIAIQAGGKSSRMGQDKGLIDFGGMALVAYIYQQIKGLSNDIFIVSNSPEEYNAFGLPVYKDVYRNIGALGGIHTVLSSMKTDHALVLACDMPFVNRDVIEQLISYANNYDVVVPRIDPRGFVEPFKAVYGRTCLTEVEAAIQQGKRRVISFFDNVRVKYVDREELQPYDPDFQSFMNVNTPEDLEKALAIANSDQL